MASSGTGGRTAVGGLAGGAAAAVLLLVSCRTCAADDAGGIRFVAPTPGSFIPRGPVVLAGHLPPEAREAFFLLNGRPLGGFSVHDGVFTGSFTPPRGFNEVEVRAGGLTARLSFAYESGARGTPEYVYHRPLLEGRCDACHRGRESGDGLTDAALCYSCHRASHLMYPYVHGPVSAGACLVCHDPHGSTFPGLARVEPERMCLRCHDQPTTAEHTSGRTRVCTLCHHPHYGINKRFLRGDYR